MCVCVCERERERKKTGMYVISMSVFVDVVLSNPTQSRNNIGQPTLLTGHSSDSSPSVTTTAHNKGEDRQDLTVQEISQEGE